MDNLPDLPLFEILIKLPPRELKYLSKSNKKLNRFLVDNEYFWETKIILETPIKYKYYSSWYQTYKRISSIPVFINIDNSEIYGGSDFANGIYAPGKYGHLQCNYTKEPNRYINYYPGERFESLIDKVHNITSKLTSKFMVMYFKDDLVLRISSYPNNANSTFLAGIIPNKILVFNDEFLINNFNAYCVYGNPFHYQDSEYAREIFRMVCKQMIVQYPIINIYKLIYAREQSETNPDEFELELEL